MELEIKEMQLNDIDFVVSEEMKIFGKSLGKRTLYKEIIDNQMARYFVAFLEGKRVGYVGSRLTIPNAEILNIFVSKGYQRHQIGTKLMVKIMAICNNEKIDFLTLEVNEKNLKAIKMYQKLGFEISHKRKKYYGNNEDALLMILKIGG